jgi:Homeodomain
LSPSTRNFFADGHSRGHGVPNGRIEQDDPVAATIGPHTASSPVSDAPISFSSIFGQPLHAGAFEGCHSFQTPTNGDGDQASGLTLQSWNPHDYSVNGASLSDPLLLRPQDIHETDAVLSSASGVCDPSRTRKSGPKEPETKSQPRFNARITTILEESFSCNPYPEKPAVAELAERTQLDEKQVRRWFTNKRSRTTIPGKVSYHVKFTNKETDHHIFRRYKSG